MGETFYKVSHTLLAPLFKGAWRIDTDGLENVPDEGPAILASNHLSYLDHFLMPAVVDRPIFFISKAQHFDVPIQSWFFEKWGVIPLARGEGDDAALRRAEQVLEGGDLFGIYPEGTRSLDGKLHKGHTGVARLALKAGVPIIPVGMIGTFEALPKGKNLPRFNKVRIRFGEPLVFEDFFGQDDERPVTRKVTDEVMQAIASLSGQAYVDAYQKNPEYKTTEERLDPVGSTAGQLPTGDERDAGDDGDEGDDDPEGDHEEAN